MKNQVQFPLPIRKALVLVIYGCDNNAALKAALTFLDERQIMLVGFVWVEEDASLSTATLSAQQVRRKVNDLSQETGVRLQTRVRVGYDLWEELNSTIRDEQPDLLILEWPCDFEALHVAPARILQDPPCDIAIIKGPISEEPSKILIPMRGGPYAEMALRLSLAISSRHKSSLTALHLTSRDMTDQQDAPFRGLARVLENLPEIDHVVLQTTNPSDTIMAQSSGFDLVIMGISARSAQMQPALGAVAERILNENSVGVIAVKTQQTIPTAIQSEAIGQTAISVLVDKWFAENTYPGDEFQNLEMLYSLKQKQGVKVSLALPALNEEATIENIIRTIRGSLMEQVPLLDEIVLLDSDSTDRTREIARSLGVPVYIHQQILPEYGPRHGKGEALWKSLIVTSGDILAWIDTDIVNIHPRFVYNLLGPLLSDRRIQFVKGFYRRPIKVGEKIQAGGGGRVTELTARPLLNLFYPELSGIIQPLSGEYAGRRSLLEQLPFFSGYGVEIGLLIDVFERNGLSSIAQVDLLERIHHNQSLEALGKMSFAIIQAVFQKLEKHYERRLLEEVNKTMKLVRYQAGDYLLDVEEIAEKDRPPMISLPEYLARHNQW